MLKMGTKVVDLRFVLGFCVLQGLLIFLFLSSNKQDLQPQIGRIDTPDTDIEPISTKNDEVKGIPEISNNTDIDCPHCETESCICGSQCCCCSPDSARCKWWKIPPYILPKCDREVLLGMLWWLRSRAQIPFYLFFGTLLGAVREGGHIDHEEDIDICVDRAVWPSVKHDIIQALSESNDTTYWLNNEDDPIRFFLSKKNKLHVDIWLYDLGNTSSSFTGWLYKAELVNDMLYPLVPCDYSGHTYWCPGNSKDWLKKEYGPN